MPTPTNLICKVVESMPNVQNVNDKGVMHEQYSYNIYNICVVFDQTQKMAHGLWIYMFLNSKDDCDTVYKWLFFSTYNQYILPYSLSGMCLFFLP